MISNGNELKCPWITLNNGEKYPQLGLGCAQLEDSGDINMMIKEALDVGYRYFETAPLYGNEKELGAALKASGYPRESYLLASKLENEYQQYDKVFTAFEKTLRAMDVDYLDTYLIHNPAPALDRYCEAWKAVEKLYEQGLVKSIGVSNFTEVHLEKLLANCNIVPQRNSIECNPYLTRDSLRNFCKLHNIWVDAWFPLGGQIIGSKGVQNPPPQVLLLENPVIVDIGKKYKKSPAQIVLRWHIQFGNIAIPKTTKRHRLQENFDIFDFMLTDADMSAITGLNYNYHHGLTADDPRVFDMKS